MKNGENKTLTWNEQQEIRDRIYFYEKYRNRMAELCHDEMLKCCKSFKNVFLNNEKFFAPAIKWLASSDSDQSRGRCGWHISYLAKKAIDATIYAFKTSKCRNKDGYRVVSHVDVGKIMHAMIITDSFFRDDHSGDINKDYCYPNYKIRDSLLEMAMPYRKLDGGVRNFFERWAMFACFEFGKLGMETKNMLYNYLDSAFVQIDSRRGEAKRPYHKYEVFDEILRLEKSENVNCILDLYYRELKKTGYPYLDQLKKLMQVNFERECDQALEDDPEMKEYLEELDRNFKGKKVDSCDEDQRQ